MALIISLSVAVYITVYAEIFSSDPIKFGYDIISY